MAIVSARDFALVVHYNKMPNGTIYILALDAGKPGLIPQYKGIVRASVTIGGWKLEPIGSNQTMCTYFEEIDFMGSIPLFVIKLMFKELGNQIVKLRKIVPKYISDNPDLA